MRVVPLGAFRDKVPFAVAVGAVERGFRALGLGEATLPDPMVMELPAEQAEVHVKGAHLKRSEEHTSELQSRLHLVCRLLLEKKKKKKKEHISWTYLRNTKQKNTGATAQTRDH